jgi:heat shock protein HslJ
MGRSRFVKALVGFMLSAAVVSCSSSGSHRGYESTATPEAERDVALVGSTEAPRLEEVADAIYRGIYETPVRLVNGRFEGEPFAEGGMSRPTVQLIGNVLETGDLDGDGSDEAVVLLVENSGGTGSFVYLAAVGRRGGEVVNLGTSLVGDRVQIRSIRVDGEHVELRVVQQGPDDAACCPSQKATRVWTLDGGLVESSTDVTGTLSTDDLSGVEWVLTHLGRNEPVPENSSITIVFENGKISGSSGCNRYFAGVTEASPGDITIGEIGSTMMACPDEVMQLEGRYLKAVGEVAGYSFLAGKLVLAYGDGGVVGAMLFEPRGQSASTDGE